METGNILREKLSLNGWGNRKSGMRTPRDRNRRGRTRSLNFLHYAEEGNHFINEVAEELGVSRNSAARITKAVLHAVRDKMPPDDAIEFAQGLPMALKAVYIEQYDISSAPVPIRHPHDFLDYIFYKDEFTASNDFPEPDSVERSLYAVFKVLRKYMDAGQIDQLRSVLGKQIYCMIQGRESYYRARKPLRFERRPSDHEFYT